MRPLKVSCVLYRHSLAGLISVAAEAAIYASASQRAEGFSFGDCRFHDYYGGAIIYAAREHAVGVLAAHIPAYSRRRARRAVA